MSVYFLITKKSKMETITHYFGPRFLNAGLRISSPFKIFMPDIWASKSLASTLQVVYPVIGYCCSLTTVPSLVTIWLSNWPVIGWRSPHPEDECPGGQQKEHDIRSCKRRSFTSTLSYNLRKISKKILLFWQKRTFRRVMRKWREEEETRDYLFVPCMSYDFLHIL